MKVDPFNGDILGVLDFRPNNVGGGEGGLDFRADGIAIRCWSQSSTGTLARLELDQTNMVAITGPGKLAPSLDGLAFDSNQVLYGLSQGSAPTLYKVDPETGQTDEVGSLGVRLSGATVGGLAFSPAGILHAALGSTTESRLYRLDLDSGLATEIGSIGYPRVSGIHFMEVRPGPLDITREGDTLKISWPHKQGADLLSAPRLTGPWVRSRSSLLTNGRLVEIFLSPTNSQTWFQLVR